MLSPDEAGSLRPWEPVYPLTQGLTQRVVVKAVTGALKLLPDLPEWISAGVLRDRSWPGWRTAVELAHAPSGPEALSPANPARQRLAYDELFSHQLALQLVRTRMKRGKGRSNAGTGELRSKALEAFGHPPTGAQSRAMVEITGDMADETRMMRLLQGDVGSRKTLVATQARKSCTRLPAVTSRRTAASVAERQIMATRTNDLATAIPFTRCSLGAMSM